MEVPIDEGNQKESSCMSIVQERECSLVNTDSADFSGPEKWEREEPEKRAVQSEENSQTLHFLDI